MCAFLDCYQGGRFSYWFEFIPEWLSTGLNQKFSCPREIRIEETIVCVGRGQLLLQPQLFAHFQLGKPEESFLISSPLVRSRSRTRHRAPTRWAVSFLRARRLLSRACEEVSENSTPGLFAALKCVSWLLSCLAYLSGAEHVWSISSAKVGLEHQSMLAEELSFNSFTAEVPACWSQLQHGRGWKGTQSHPWGCQETEVAPMKWAANGARDTRPGPAKGGWGVHGAGQTFEGDWMSSWRRNSLRVNIYAESKHV